MIVNRVKHFAYKIFGVVRILKVVCVASFLVMQVACVRDFNYAQGIRDFHDQNYRSAFIHLLPQAINGRPEAQYAVGYMYYYGQGVTEDRVKAWNWITLAAKAGQADALEAMVILRRQNDPLIAGLPGTN